ncbi:LysR family transcriptional regulator [Gluconacetobacter takamatsuzukensis]|uniref:LysR family transcriptional regulator n=1 Tax=Gluconacetobacter takamatsuzukensis TaxID=1286190 RepID=A0A7W4PQ02_9PROT|nr:LysR family transcriptional regulator [Gluconacetobacter takamatsuzukensis]
MEYVLGSLRILEAAGRLGSFSAAAAELGMTQPGVSQQVAQIERVIGVSLFARGHRGVVLTDAGRALFAAATDSMARVRRCLEEIAVGGPGRHILVVTDYGFAANWLLSRLADFEQGCPGVEIQIVTTQTLSEAALGGMKPDVSILFEPALAEAGEEGAEGSRRMLFREEIYPICSPRYLERHGPFETLEDIRAGHLLRLKGRETLWFGWEDWFAAMEAAGGETGGARINIFRSFSHYPLLLQSACQDEGIALGWRPLIDPALAAGDLVRAWPVPLTSARGYVLASHRPLRPEARLFHDWIVAQAGQDREAGA